MYLTILGLGENKQIYEKSKNCVINCTIAVRGPPFSVGPA